MIPALAAPLLSAASSLLTSQISAGPPHAAAKKAAGADFSQVMAQITNDAVDGMKAAEATSISAIRGKVSAQTAVEAILAAERTLQTAIAVRDKLVSAIQEVTRLSM